MLRRADGTELVLRRPGRHLTDIAASSFARESKVLTALARTPVPHPRLQESPAVDKVAGWLEAHRPQTARIGIVHGDSQPVSGSPR